MDTLTRKLGFIETAWAQVHDFRPFNTVSVLRLDDGPPPEIVQQALNLLQQRQPLLRVSLRKQSGQYYFQEAPPPHTFPLRVIPRQDDAHWHTLTEAEMKKSPRLDAAPLANCFYLYAAEAPSELILVCHHAILDAASGVKFLDNLLTLCAMRLAGNPLPNLEPLTLLPPLEELFPPAHRGSKKIWQSLALLQGQTLPELRYRRQGIDRNTVPENGAGARCQFISVRLPKTTTTALIKCTRQKRVTLNAALNAAAQLAALKYCYTQPNIWMRGATFANLRPYLQPPLPPDYLGAYFAMIPYTLIPTDNFWDLATQLNRIFYQAAKSGDKFIFAVLAKYMTRFLLGLKKMRLASVANSYVGAINLQPAYGPIRVKGLHGFAVNNVLGPPCSIFNRLLFGELLFDMPYMSSDMNRAEAQALGAEIQQILEVAVHNG